MASIGDKYWYKELLCVITGFPVIQGSPNKSAVAIQQSDYPESNVVVMPFADFEQLCFKSVLEVGDEVVSEVMNKIKITYVVDSILDGIASLYNINDDHKEIILKASVDVTKEGYVTITEGGDGLTTYWLKTMNLQMIIFNNKKIQDLLVKLSTASERIGNTSPRLSYTNIENADDSLTQTLDFIYQSLNV